MKAVVDTPQEDGDASGEPSSAGTTIDDGRLPEEQPGTPWNTSAGIRMAYSAILAEREEMREGNQPPPVAGQADVGSKDEALGSDAEIIKSNSWGLIALRAARYPHIGENASASDLLGRTQDGFLDKDVFLSRLRQLLKRDATSIED